MKKYGGFDNYILNFGSKKMSSEIGLKFRKLMQAKLKDRSMVVPYIPKTGFVCKTKCKTDLIRQ